MHGSCDMQIDMHKDIWENYRSWRKQKVNNLALISVNHMLKKLETFLEKGYEEYEDF